MKIIILLKWIFILYLIGVIFMTFVIVSIANIFGGIELTPGIFLGLTSAGLCGLLISTIMTLDTYADCLLTP
jgi:hypothetical protein